MDYMNEPEINFEQFIEENIKSSVERATSGISKAISKEIKEDFRGFFEKVFAGTFLISDIKDGKLLVTIHVGSQENFTFSKDYHLLKIMKEDFEGFLKDAFEYKEEVFAISKQLRDFADFIDKYSEDLGSLGDEL